MKTSSLSFRVYVTPEEKYHIVTSARDCRMSTSAFCRTLALGVMPTSKRDLEQVDTILKAMANLNRLGNLMKMALTNTERLHEMGGDMATASIDGILVDIRFSVAKLREMIDAINGVTINDVDEHTDEAEEAPHQEEAPHPVMGQ